MEDVGTKVASMRNEKRSAAGCKLVRRRRARIFASFQFFRPAPDRLVLEKIAQRSGHQARDIVLLWF
jgi:hypothetical protein